MLHVPTLTALRSTRGRSVHRCTQSSRHELPLQCHYVTASAPAPPIHPLIHQLAAKGVRFEGWSVDSLQCSLKPSLRVTVTLKGFGQRPINGASILVNRTRSKQLFHTSQNRPSFCAFYWVTTAKRVSGWPRERNIGGVTGELRRLGLTVFISKI